MTTRIHPTLGIIGGGQLAKMIAQSAIQLGCHVVVLERQPHGPAAAVAREFLTGDWNDPAALLTLAGKCDVVTLENEFVDARALAALEASGVALFPSASTIDIVQDKFRQKTCLQDAGVPVPQFVATPSRADVAAAGERFGWPLVLKARRDGYDGKGNATVDSASAIDDAWRTLGGDHERALYAEGFCRFERELAVIVTRDREGRSVVYPVVETVQRNHICHIVRAPAPVPEAVAARVRSIAQRALDAVGAVGTFGVECFQTTDGDVLINELAPRVHNSGHYTIEACASSQFDNHVRAVMGWPLGSPAMRTPAAVMVNLLGESAGPGWPAGVADALAVPGAALHVYGKLTSSRGRKMGHITALGETVALAESVALKAADALTFGESA